MKGPSTRAGLLGLLSRTQNSKKNAPHRLPPRVWYQLLPTRPPAAWPALLGILLEGRNWILFVSLAGSRLCHLPRFDIMNYYLLGGLNHRNVLSHTVLESKSPKSRCQQVRFLLEALREILVHASPLSCSPLWSFSKFHVFWSCVMRCSRLLKWV